MWGSFGNDFKYHLLKLNIVKQPLRKGGLGIRDLIIFNEAILGKWLWRFINEKNKFRRTVVRAKYGVEGLDWIPRKQNDT